MPAETEVAKLRRAVDALTAAVNLDLAPGSRSPMPPKDRRSIKSAIEQSIQELDELRTRLTG